MVSALSRQLPNEIVREKFDYNISCLLLRTEDAKTPCALREFINSNSDLPTIEELARTSPQLAEVIGVLH
jgi:hypothetical protein